MEVVLYSDGRGREPLAEYIADLRRSGERTPLATLERYIDLLEDNGPDIGMPMARMIDRERRIYELRVGDHRVAYAEFGGEIVLLHAWRKQAQKLHRKEAATARRRLDGLRGR